MHDNIMHLVHHYSFRLYERMRVVELAWMAYRQTVTYIIAPCSDTLQDVRNSCRRDGDVRAVSFSGQSGPRHKSSAWEPRVARDERPRRGDHQHGRSRIPRRNAVNHGKVTSALRELQHANILGICSHVITIHQILLYICSFVIVSDGK